MAKDTAEGLKDAIRVDTSELRGHVDVVVRSSVEEMLNALLQAEADGICGATRYERSPSYGYARKHATIGLPSAVVRTAATMAILHL